MIGRHLSRERLLALAEGQSLEDVHLEACESCLAEIQSLRAVLRDVHAADIPEPSPLFWDHLARRIHASVATEAARLSQASPSWSRWLQWAAALVLASGLGLATLLPGMTSRSTTAARPVTMMTAEPFADDAWQFVVTVLEGSDSLEQVEHAASPGTADALVADLDADERAALVMLLRQELGGS
jgi:hypothetical protein